MFSPLRWPQLLMAVLDVSPTAHVMARHPSVCMLTISFPCDTGTNRDGFESHSEYGYIWPVSGMSLIMSEIHAE